jgi:hypothetical protein
MRDTSGVRAAGRCSSTRITGPSAQPTDPAGRTFDGHRYLKYKAFLSTTDAAATPTFQSVRVCFRDAVWRRVLTVEPVHADAEIEGGRIEEAA